MVWWRDLDEIRCLPMLEEKGDIGLECALVAFDREVVMRLALHQMGRQFALCQQGIGGDVLALDIECVQQRNEHPDFIGLFGFLAACYGQGTDFFWV